MKRMVAILIVFLMIILTGCNEKITEGEVYGKEFKEEYTTIIMTPITHSNGKTSYTTIIPITYHYPDRWVIRIRSLEKNKDGEYETAEYYVTQEVFDDCNIGDIFSYDKDRDYREEPVEKSK